MQAAGKKMRQQNPCIRGTWLSVEKVERRVESVGPKWHKGACWLVSWKRCTSFLSSLPAQGTPINHLKFFDTLNISIVTEMGTRTPLAGADMQDIKQLYECLRYGSRCSHGSGLPASQSVSH